MARTRVERYLPTGYAAVWLHIPGEDEASYADYYFKVPFNGVIEAVSFYTLPHYNGGNKALSYQDKVPIVAVNKNGSSIFERAAGLKDPRLNDANNERGFRQPTLITKDFNQFIGPSTQVEAIRVKESVSSISAGDTLGLEITSGVDGDEIGQIQAIVWIRMTDWPTGEE